jgi:hypothetical protein
MGVFCGLCSIGMLVAGAVMCVFQTERLKTFLPTPATVDVARIESNHGYKYGPHFSVRVFYHYSAGTRTYSVDESLGCGIFMSDIRARSVVQRYPVHAHVMAFRSPREAAIATLVHEPELISYIWLLMGAAMGMAALGPIITEDLLPKPHPAGRARRLVAYPILFGLCLGAVAFHRRSLGWRLGEDSDDWFFLLVVVLVAAWLAVMLARWALASLQDPSVPATAPPSRPRDQEGADDTQSCA